MPLVDAARILAIEGKINAKNTLKRFAELIQREPQNKEVYEHCIHAYTTLLDFRTRQGLANKNSGRFIDLAKLGKLEKMSLKDCFKAVKDVQQLLQVRFQLSHFL